MLISGLFPLLHKEKGLTILQTRTPVDALRGTLEEYCQDSDPLVASVAQLTFPPDEPNADISV